MSAQQLNDDGIVPTVDPSDADPGTIAVNPIVPDDNPIALASPDTPHPGELVNVAAAGDSNPAGTTFNPAQPKPTPHLNTGGRAPIRPRQRLVICCDGTWQSRETVKSVIQGTVVTGGDDKWLTNIAVLASAIAPDAGVPDENGIIIRQNVFYIPGVGTTITSLQNLYEGMTGASLADKVEDGYSFLCDNHSEGDEIFLFGFSRGAYTARCIAAFVNWAGILKKSELIWFRTVWEAFQKRKPEDPKTLEAAAEVLRKYTGRYPSRDASETSSDAIKDGVKIEKAPDSAVERVQEKVSWAKAPPITVLGVFDTVGSLGIPGNYMTPAVQKLFSFFDPGLGANVRNAFHALSLTEERQDFSPTLFFQDPKEIRDEWPRQVLRQMWFGGEHSDVGGGWIDHGASDVSLAWMIGQVMDTYEKPLLNIDLDVIRSLQDRREEWGKQKDHDSRSKLELKGIRQVNHKYTDNTDVTTWANNCRVGYRHERLHHSLVTSGKYDPETSPHFEEMRKTDRSLLDRLWKEASDPNSLTKTERLLKWDAAEKDQVQPLVGAGVRGGARGSAGNGEQKWFNLELPMQQEVQHEPTVTNRQEPKTLHEKMKLGVDVVETSLADAFKSAALIPDAIASTFKSKKKKEAEDEEKAATAEQ
ncbi:hypothetical protein OC846_003072 [Tilletia horrida]|uniref:T6SS Phospholipase effector Tle1-like catalytic domain-containing protein n=1 Tax=Tilletia horrida TaxID=155126 RepID=A0AAN6JS26_9BASI|nr:hypothetical protein OC846_003072 [Tilletia horrida]KAK0566167.1 hypothetical protein OC861_003388 [Tilletia horrida]